MRNRVPPAMYSTCKNVSRTVRVHTLTLLSEARSVDKDGAARVAKDLAADAAVMSPPKRRELGRARVTARRDMV